MAVPCEQRVALSLAHPPRTALALPGGSLQHILTLCTQYQRLRGIWILLNYCAAIQNLCNSG